MNETLKAVESPTLSKRGRPRYVLVNIETGEIVDDAQGYGYKTASGAHRSWAYTHRDKSKDKEKQAEYSRIKKWLKEHKSFVNLLEAELFDISVGRVPGGKFDAKLVQEVLDTCGLEIDFKIRDLIRVWNQS